MEYRLKVLSMFEIGQRDNQEDYMFPQPGEATDECRSFVLCDGMGGHDSGEVASRAVCCTMGECITGAAAGAVFTKEMFLDALAAAYKELDARDTKAAKKMGTTMTFLKFHSAGCFVAHIGDSRVYHMRPQRGILFETRDHSLVNDLVKIGELTEEEARDFPNRNVITRCMQPGGENRCRADVKEIADVRAGDYFFMCSDGVNEVLESSELAAIILSPSFTDEEKLEAVRAATEEACDNHTAFLVHVLDVEGAVPAVDEQPCCATDAECNMPVGVHGACASVPDSAIANDTENGSGKSALKVLAVVVAAFALIAAVVSLCYFLLG